MAVLPAAAAAAYRAAAHVGSQSTAAAVSGADKIGGANFSDFLSSAMKDSIDTMKKGEAMATGQVTGANGKGNLIDVVTAVNAAEVTLDTVVAVRDKVITAYQTIMNMSI